MLIRVRDQNVALSCSYLLGVGIEKTIPTTTVVMSKARLQESLSVTLPHGYGFDLPNSSCLVENGF